ncbi:hypothetical protein fHeYen902_119c [Yersinia phage fHe-Yen9-02]|nr:hypothetical protein fHeYen902_119c [Yersinia phage fHe-Yen9-02]
MVLENSAFFNPKNQVDFGKKGVFKKLFARFSRPKFSGCFAP